MLSDAQWESLCFSSTVRVFCSSLMDHYCRDVLGDCCARRRKKQRQKRKRSVNAWSLQQSMSVKFRRRQQRLHAKQMVAWIPRLRMTGPSNQRPPVNRSTTTQVRTLSVSGISWRYACVVVVVLGLVDTSRAPEKSPRPAADDDEAARKRRRELLFGPESDRTDDSFTMPPRQQQQPSPPVPKLQKQQQQQQQQQQQNQHGNGGPSEAHYAAPRTHERDPHFQTSADAAPGRQYRDDRPWQDERGHDRSFGSEDGPSVKSRVTVEPYIPPQVRKVVQGTRESLSRDHIQSFVAVVKQQYADPQSARDPLVSLQQQYALAAADKDFENKLDALVWKAMAPEVRSVLSSLDHGMLAGFPCNAVWVPPDRMNCMCVCVVAFRHRHVTHSQPECGELAQHQVAGSWWSCIRGETCCRLTPCWW